MHLCAVWNLSMFWLSKQKNCGAVFKKKQVNKSLSPTNTNSIIICRQLTKCTPPAPRQIPALLHSHPFVVRSMPYSMRSDLCEIEDSRSDVMLLLKLSYKILQLNIRVNLSTSPDLGEANWCVMRAFRQQMKRAMWQGTEISSQSQKGTETFQ